jgi:hypothetical protein
MTQTLPGADIRGYYDALGIEIPGWAQREACVRCFADPDTHRRGDRQPSCSVNLDHGAWHCHGCGARGGAHDAATALGYSSRAAIDLMIEHGLTVRRMLRSTSSIKTVAATRTRVSSRAAENTARRRLLIGDADVRHWQSALPKQTQLIARLARERGWLFGTMLELGLGFDCGHVTIPVRDHDRRLVGLLQYQPQPKPGQPKMRAALGSRRRLLPHPAAELSEQILLVEGEPDMIAARSRGLPAISIPGVDAWRAEWARLLDGRQVTIAMDCDDPGRKAAAVVANDLASIADVRVLDLAPDRHDGYDLTDWLLEHEQQGVAWR